MHKIRTVATTGWWSPLALAGALFVLVGCGAGSTGLSGAAVSSGARGSSVSTYASTFATTPSNVPRPSGAATTAAATRSTGPALPSASIALPPVNGQFDYQIGGAYAPEPAVAIVDRDHDQASVSGRYNICYVNAFQTQPEAASFWTGEHPDLIVRHGGAPVTDPNWPGEFILDTSTEAKRTSIAAIVEPWLSECAAKGFQAVEPDNLDSWTRSAGVLQQADNVALATQLTAFAHGLGLAVAQKNTGQLGAAGPRDVHFDFALAEECQVYDECATYTAAYGDHVIEVEYTDTGTEAYRQACAAQGRQISVILRDRDVVARGQKGYEYQAC